MAYQPLPQTTKDGEKKVTTSDNRLLEAIEENNFKLAILIKHMEALTNEIITEDDLEET